MEQNGLFKIPCTIKSTMIGCMYCDNLYDFNESDVFSFYTGTESKINNSGDTNISGYLLMQVEFLNTSQGVWELEVVVVNETSPRAIDCGGVLALDTIFNREEVNTGSFVHGNGTYRVYVAFRDPYGNVLWVGGDADSQYGSGGYYLSDTYEFTVTFD